MFVVESCTRGRRVVCTRCDLREGRLPSCGPGRKRRLEGLAPIEQKAPQVRHTNRTLAGTGSGERGTFDQFELLKTRIPDPLEVVDLNLRARAHRSGLRTLRDVCLESGITDHTNRDVPREASGHSQEGVAWSESEIDRRGVAGPVMFLPCAVLEDDGSKFAFRSLRRLLALLLGLRNETNQIAVSLARVDALWWRADGYEHAEINAGFRESLGRAPGHHSQQLTAFRNRLNLGGTRGDHNFNSRANLQRFRFRCERRPVGQGRCQEPPGLAARPE